MTTRLRGSAARAAFAGAALLAGLSVLVPAAARASGVHAALDLAHVVVEPDSSFTLSLDITSADAAFNGFAAVIGYDPSALTFLPASPTTAQEGCLLTGGCSASCGNVFHRFTAAGDSLSAQASLLCDSVLLTGPGSLYTLTFRAANTDQTTWVRVRRLQFWNGGVAVNPVATADAEVDIHRTLDVPRADVSPGLALAASPNPARGALALAIASGAAGEQAVDVLDLAGRRVRTLERAWCAAGTRSVRWDGAADDGTRLPAGVYLVRVRSGALVAQSRVVLLH